LSETNDLEDAVASLVAGGSWRSEHWDARNGEHPPDDLIAGYAGDELDAEDSAALLDHLATCRECTALVADLAALHHLPAVAGEPGEGESAAAWRALRERLDGEPRRGPSVTVPPRPIPLWRSPGWAVAAVLLVTCLVTGSWALHLGDQIHELEAPQPNVPLVDLAAGATRGGASDETTVVARGAYYLLIFYPQRAEGNGERTGTYSWTLADAAGRQVLAGDGLEIQSGDYMTLLLHGRGLPPGSYRLRVFGRSGTGTTPVGEQVFRLAAGG
jgi:hypothetical protein